MRLKKEVFDKLAQKMSTHFPLKEGGCAGAGYPGQAPYRTDLLRIFILAFESSDKSDELDIRWERLEEKLLDAVIKENPRLTYNETADIFRITGAMWNEWCYICSKLRNGDDVLPMLTLVDTHIPPFNHLIFVE